MSPFRHRQGHPSPPLPSLSSPTDVPPPPPHAPRPAAPSRIPTAKSTTSLLSLVRTRSRGNELEGVSQSDVEASSPDWTIRKVVRPGDDDDEVATAPRGVELASYPTYSSEMDRTASTGSGGQPREQNKLQKWLSRSTHPSSSSSSHSTSRHSSDLPPPAPQPPHPGKTRTTRSRSIGSLNLLSQAINSSPAKVKRISSRPSTADSTSALSNRPPLATNSSNTSAPPTIEISSSPSTTFSPSSPTQSTSPASSPSLSHSVTSSPALSQSSSTFAPSCTTVEQPVAESSASPLRRGSIASSTTSSAHSSLRGSLAALSLKPRSGSGRSGVRGARKRPTTDEVLEEWATAELSEGDEEGRQISEDMVRALSRSSQVSIASSSSPSVSPARPAKEGSSGSGGGGGVLAKSLRRTRSGLKLFGGGITASRSREATTESVETGGEGVYGGGLSGANSSMVDLASTSPTPTSAVVPTAASSGSNTSQQLYHPYPSSSSALSPHQQPHNPFAGRIGGWFSSMIPRSTATGGGPSSASSSSTHLPLDPDQQPYSAHSSPEKTRRAPASSSSPSGYRLSPKKSSNAPSNATTSPSGGRLGAFDRILDRAAQYFFDSDSRADECEDEIWVLGVCHPGYSAVVMAAAARESSGEEIEDKTGEAGHEGEEGAGRAGGGQGGPATAKKRKSLPSLGRKSRSPTKQRKGGPPPPPPVPAITSVVAGVVDPFLVPSTPTPSTSAHPSPSDVSSGSLPFASATPSPRFSSSTLDLSLPPTINGWPSSFYHDFYSRIALTYRTGFPFIPCSPPSSSSPAGGSGGGVGGVLSSLGASIGRGGRTGINDVRDVGSEGLNSDTGWGCMLRTGQSLLANALMVVHLGRDWRRPIPPATLASASTSSTHLPYPSSSATVADPATYARLLSLFLDTPTSPSLSPFSVHAFAVEGKKLGKNPGEWFGPSTAAGAIKALVNAYEPAGLRVVSCVDGTVYESEVRTESEGWRRPVLVLVNVRLGIDGVNPIYHEAIKGIFRLSQTVGIAGGRPSSSYYFVGSQANSLFYIDPHHPRPAITAVQPSPAVEAAAESLPLSWSSPVPSASGDERVRQRVDTQETARGVSDSFVTVAPPRSTSHFRSRTPSPAPPPPPLSSAASQQQQDLDAFLLSSYPDSAWATYHADKVRKCTLSSLDPSMLLGFLVCDEGDWQDFRKGVEELFQSSAPIFSIATAPPRWMRRSTSTAVPPASATANTTEDSFDDLGAQSSSFADGGGSPSLSRPVPGATEEGESSTGFSEPEDWELDSTDGLSASGGSGSGSGNGGNSSRDEQEQRQRKVERVDEGWEDATGSTSSTSPRVESTSAASNSAASSAEEECVAVQAPRSSDSAEKGAVEEAGWEGI